MGVIGLARDAVGPFPSQQIALLKTFADQAVIAIGNARLLRETHAALEQQTATSEILRVISSSPTDTQPVFDAIIRNAVRLSGATWGLVSRIEGQMMHLVALHNLEADNLARVRANWPQSVHGRSPTPGHREWRHRPNR